MIDLTGSLKEISKLVLNCVLDSSKVSELPAKFSSLKTVMSLFWSLSFLPADFFLMGRTPAPRAIYTATADISLYFITFHYFCISIIYLLSIDILSTG